uniref:acetyl-CoA C-acetyltransferase n=1 Tax=viral metagenome TaxID=1070528 RepID=A0A6C0LYH2_9ZZZZ
MERKEIFIINYKRTPIGNFLSKLSSLSAVELASLLIEKLCKDINKDDIGRVYIGNVLSSGLGQNIARQISFKNNINSPSVTINRVCSSGMQSIIEGYKSICFGESELVLVGGTESMSQSPYIIDKLRKGNKFGNMNLKDTLLLDGLTDPFSGNHMGELTENTIEKYELTRNELDNYSKMSYKRARNSYEENKFKNEVIDIEIKSRKDSIIVNEDEEVNKIKDLDKLYNLKPVFCKNGKLTPGNSSKLSDGACLLLLASKEYIVKNNIKPIAKILDFDLSVGNPRDFSVVPIKSVRQILKNNNLTKDDIDYFEINEAFANVPVLLNKELGVDYKKINIFGGAIAMGHPLGCSGARIVTTLLTILQDKNANLGLASICNGGGGATSLLIEKIN